MNKKRYNLLAVISYIFVSVFSTISILTIIQNGFFQNKCIIATSLESVLLYSIVVLIALLLGYYANKTRSE